MKDGFTKLDIAQHFLLADVALERERVAKEHQEQEVALRRSERQEAVQRQRLEPVLATSENAFLRRLSPRKTWSEVAEIDRRVEELEHRRATISDELLALQERLAATVEADRGRLAEWVTAGAGDRPEPTAPRLRDRIEQLEAERGAADLATDGVLGQKVKLVQKIRPRLVKDARKRRKQALARYERLVAEVEQTRDEVTALVEGEAWALRFPAEVEDLGLLRMKGGRLSAALPDFKGLAAFSQVTDWLRDDSRWLGGLLDDKPDDALDIRKEGVWEQTEEGAAALDREKKRIIEGLAPRAARQAEWLS